MSVNIRIRNGLQPDSYSGLGGATEGDVRGDLADLISSLSGVVNVSGGHLRAHEADSPGMEIIVDEGVGYIPNDSYDEFDSDSIKFWEAVVGGTEGERTLAISPNSSGQTRVDLLCLEIDPGTEPDENASNIASLVIVEGTPGAGAPATPAFRLKLYEINVVNGATEIKNEDLTDFREQIKLNPVVVPPIAKRVVQIVSSATPTPNMDVTDILEITALAEAATFGAPTGTPTDGQGLIMRIKDNGTNRALAYNSIYRAMGIVLPTTTTANKTLYIGFIYNAGATKWDAVAATQEG